MLSPRPVSYTHLDVYKRQHYGELSKVPVYKLRQVMNYLMLNEYLAVTNDEYAIVKLTGKSKLIMEDRMVLWKWRRRGILCCFKKKR